MFASITKPLKAEARDALNFAVVAVAVGLSATLAFMFGAVAVFVAVQQTYGALYASLAEIAYCVAVAGAMVGAIMVFRNKVRIRAAARAGEEELERRRMAADAPSMWKDPGILTAALPFVMKAAQFGIRNRTLFGLAAGGAMAAWTTWQASNIRMRATASESKRQ